MNTTQFTSLKFPHGDRKGRASIERTLDDRLGTIAWRQDAHGPTECILVALDNERAFVPIERYSTLKGPQKRIDGKLVMVSLRRPTTKRRPRQQRLLREGCYGPW